MMDKFRWGVLSTALIGVEKVIPALQKSELCDVVAIASRDPDRPCKMWLQQGEEIEEIAFEICDQYTLQGDAMARAILNDTPVPTPLADAVANMRVVEAVVQSAVAEAWVSLPC